MIWQLCKRPEYGSTMCNARKVRSQYIELSLPSRHSDCIRYSPVLSEQLTWASFDNRGVGECHAKGWSLRDFFDAGAGVASDGVVMIATPTSAGLAQIILAFGTPEDASVSHRQYMEIHAVGGSRCSRHSVIAYHVSSDDRIIGGRKNKLLCNGALFHSRDRDPGEAFMQMAVSCSTRAQLLLCLLEVRLADAGKQKLEGHMLTVKSAHQRPADRHSSERKFRSNTPVWLRLVDSCLQVI